MQLICVRHGEAQSVQDDPYQGLTAEGGEAIRKMATYLASIKCDVSQLFFSPKSRTEQTANIFADHLNIQHNAPLPLLMDSEIVMSDFMAVFDTWNDDTMIVSHLPLLHRIISHLVVGDEHFYPLLSLPPGAVVCLERYEGLRFMIRWALRSEIVPSTSM